MNKLLDWAGTIGRFFLFLKSTAVAVGRFVLVGFPRFLAILVLQELLWRWWLGYGERPFRVLSVIGLILVVTWLLYWQVGTFVLDSSAIGPQTGRPTSQDALYYSLVSFSALGYGGWAPQPTGWVKWVGAVQPFFGIISAVALSINLHPANHPIILDV